MCCRRRVWRRSAASGWCSATSISRSPPGGALLLTGPNGSGKSTLLRLLAGLLRPAAGTLTWDGADALADLPAHARRVAYVGHQDAVKPGLTAAENLRFAARLTGGDVRDALAAVGLEELADLPARMLSAGQRRRLALARLVLSRAPLWLLDEPTLGLDAASVERFGAMLDGAPRRRRHGGCRDASAAAGARGRGARLRSMLLTDVRRMPRPPRIRDSRFLAVLARELRLSLRHGADTLAALLFFLLTAALFPLAIGPAPETLGRIAPGIVWVCALLAALLPLDRLFGADFEDGSLDQLLLCGTPQSRSWSSEPSSKSAPNSRSSGSSAASRAQTQTMPGAIRPRVSGAGPMASGNSAAVSRKNSRAASVSARGAPRDAVRAPGWREALSSLIGVPEASGESVSASPAPAPQPRPLAAAGASRRPPCRRRHGARPA